MVYSDLKVMMLIKLTLVLRNKNNHTTSTKLIFVIINSFM